MKTNWIWKLVVLSWTLCVGAHAKDQVVEARSERGPHHKVWQTIREEVTSYGKTYLRTNSYVELGTGLHYWEDNQWKETKEEIQIVDGAAVAAQGPHKVIFAANLNSVGAIDMESPDGKRFRSHVTGLAYTDSMTGASVMIAQVKDSVGAVLPPNQVIYQDAFDGDVIADVRYTYTKGGFEQDVIILTAPPDPRAYGADFDPSTTRLEVWTEFIEIPEGKAQVVELKREEDPLARQAMFEPDLIDERLDYGVMKFETGQSFPVGRRDEAYVPTGKSLEDIGGRIFLIEKTDYRDISQYFNDLPQAQATQGRKVWKFKRGERRMAQGVPKSPDGLKGVWKEKQFAAMDLRSPRKGLVIDYTTVNGSITNYTFQGDRTYYVSSSLNLYQTTVFEGGSVIKFPSGTVALSLYGPATFLTSPWHPAVLTAKDDDSSGETISGSTGSPTGVYALTALTFRDTTTTNVAHNLRVRYASRAFSTITGVKLIVKHTQIGPGGNGYLATAGTAQFQNTLFHNLSYAFFTSVSITNYAEQCTFHRISNFLLTGTAVPARLTNSLVIAVTNNTQHTGGSDVIVTNNDAGFFQTVGVGSRYLADSSPYRNAGTTNINPALREDLKTRTTYPPSILTNKIFSSLTLSAHVARDADGPDLGYHYDPLDYLAQSITVSNAVLNVTNGCTVGIDFSGTNYGIFMDAGASVVSRGLADNLNRFVRIHAVQEGLAASGSGYGAYGMFADLYLSDPEPAFDARFTDFPLLCTSYLFNQQNDRGYLGKFILKDSQVRGGNLFLSHSLSNSLIAWTNTLFERTHLTIHPYTVINFEGWNNLFWKGELVLGNNISGSSWTIKDNLFDETDLYQAGGLTPTHDYNGYVSGADRWTPSGSNDKILTNAPTYLTATLGTYYYPTNDGMLSTLLDVGSRYATNAGLYHFTLRVDETKEGASVNDIGFHYVATDSGGDPIDTDGDGVPDYYEDTNGNGSADSGETDWQNSESLFGLGSGPSIEVFTPLNH